MASTRKYKLYAALHADIAEGSVWLEEKQPAARCIVRITYSKNGHRRSVFCEALQIEKNFLNLYNREPSRFKIETKEHEKEGENGASPMVMNHWYRARLSPKEPLKTQEEHCLEITPFDRLLSYHNRWYGKLRACMGHPQAVVRVAVWLALLSVVLGGLSFFGVTASRGVTVRALTRNIVQRVRPVKGNTTTPSALTVDDLLAWRGVYGDLLGKPRQAAIERFGISQDEAHDQDVDHITWKPSPRTGDRQVTVLFWLRAGDDVVKGVKVFPRPNESLDAMEVLKKAPMFKFGTGTY